MIRNRSFLVLAGCALFMLSLGACGRRSGSGGDAISHSTTDTRMTRTAVSPVAVTVDSSGNVYVADYYAHAIRRISSMGVITVLAGGVSPGDIDGTGAAASFSFPAGVAVDTAGNVYVADSGNNQIRKVTPAGVVTTLAGKSAAGSEDGVGANANFNQPSGVAVDTAGNVYVADSGNNQIRKVTPAGVVTTLAGKSAAGSEDGVGANANFNQPSGVAVDAAGNVFVADGQNCEIRKITPAGLVTTLAGSKDVLGGHADGSGATANFYLPYGVAVDGSGNIYVADSGNNEIRKITPAGEVTTVAGNPMRGDADGARAGAGFYSPFGVAVDGAGNLYVADAGNREVRKVTRAGIVTTLAGK
jgi:serine/threonine-protein kinase